MKKVFSLLLSLTMVMALLAGCGGDTTTDTADDSTTDTADTTETTELSGTVNTNGSTSMEDVMGTLIEAFKEVQPGVTVNYTGSGSGAGITGAQEGTCDIGLASRDLKEDETGVSQITVAKDGIAIIVNPENPVSDLSIEQIAALATGATANWSEVGGNDAEVVFMGREAGSGTRDGFESITGTEDTCVYTQELTSTGAVIEAVKSNPSAIGYASLSAVEGQEGIKAITVGGVACTEENVQNGSYEIQRPFVMVTNSATELSEPAQAFMDFATSSDADDLIREAGAVPVAE